MSNKYKKYQLAFIIIAVLGLLTSVYLTYNHFNAGKGVCDINDTVSCSTVNTSIYSYFLEIPVAILGGIWSLVLLGMAAKLKRRPNIYVPALFAWFVLGIISIIYLITAEILLRAICPACTVFHILVLMGFILVMMVYRKEEQKATFKETFIHLKWHFAALAVIVFALWLGFNWVYLF